MKKETISVSVGGKEITFETGKIARQANGAVIVKCGDTVVLSSACHSPSREETDFLPLRVDYQEKFSSVGKTLGGFIKREGRPTEKEILTSRLIDRPIRPFFEEGFYDEVQLLNYALSYDGVNSPEMLALCGASAALVISDIPLIKPLAGVRVGYIDSQFVINPSPEEMSKSRLDLLLAGTEEAILMIEGYADFMPEEQILEAIQEGHAAIKKICQALADLRSLAGKPKKRETLRVFPKDLMKDIDALVRDEYPAALRITEKVSREDALSVLDEKIRAALCPEGEEAKYSKVEVKFGIKKYSSGHMRKMILEENKRCDGRSTSDIRFIDVETSLLPRTHGSALFTRGETQAIAVCTLGGEGMAQRYETLDEDGARRFYLQYSFPPFSVGEVGRSGPPGRREIGHGKLAERALAAAIPQQEHFPYTIRLESNITESNGSSSMASVCGGCLSMMDAGVPIKRPIAGIAMGLILENEKYAILSDILGIEDACGDMDFKITGDGEGVTAFQLDIKVEGITPQIMKVALEQAKEGRVHILKKMLDACPKSREHLSKHAPKIEIIQVKPSKIAIIIGPGGKQIRAIIEETGVDIDINDQGLVSITSNDADKIDEAKKIIVNLTADVEVGKVYKGKIVSIKDFGLFVAIFSKEGLCHISELSHTRIDNIYDHFKEGDMLEVKVLEINDRGQIRLSHKALLEAPSRA